MRGKYKYIVDLCFCKKCNLSVQVQREHILIRWFRFELVLTNCVDFAKIAATAGAACGLCFAESMGIGGVQVDCWNQAFQTPACHQDGVVIGPFVVVVVVIPALTKGYIGNAALKIQNEMYDIVTAIK